MCFNVNGVRWNNIHSILLSSTTIMQPNTLWENEFEYRHWGWYIYINARTICISDNITTSSSSSSLQRQTNGLYNWIKRSDASSNTNHWLATPKSRNHVALHKHSSFFFVLLFFPLFSNHCLPFLLIYLDLLTFI